ncbi:MAG: peptidase M4 [Acidobacteriota bacterium]|nr:peptidase M4 [Acidobacteriota bacterium]
MARKSSASGGVAKGNDDLKQAVPPPSPSWMELEEPEVRTLKVYALDPSAGNYIGNVMSVNVKWEKDLKPGPVGHRIAVVDYDAANKQYYPPVDLNNFRIVARDGLDPSESDPRFHQQMVYAVATETVEKFESALGRRIHWRRADRHPGGDDSDPDVKKPCSWRKADDIWVLNLFPHAMIQANAFYSPEAKGILFGYFTAKETNQGRNLPGQRVFTCLSHDIIAHEVTHAIVDGIRTYFTEPTNPDVLAFHEGFADLAALFSHFSHKEALLDTIQKTGGQLYQFELQPDAAPTGGRTSPPPPASRSTSSQSGVETSETDNTPGIVAQVKTRNPLIDLAQQFGEASGMNRGLRSALDVLHDPKVIQTRINDAHFRGSILVAAVFDAYFSVYVKRTADLFRIYRAGGGDNNREELPGPLARLLAEQASVTATEFFQLCACALDYCPPVDITFGDFLRALMTANRDLKPEEGSVIRDALMQAFRARGIYPENASFFTEDALCWPRLPKWKDPPDKGALPPVQAVITHPKTGKKEMTSLVFGSPSELTREEQDINGMVLRQYARDNAAILGFDPDPSLADEFKPYAPSFHPSFHITPDGSLRTDMMVEMVQTKEVPFDASMPKVGSFPMRGGVTLVVSAPEIKKGVRGLPEVRFAVGKCLTGDEGQLREKRQRSYYLAMGLLHGNTDNPRHFQANFGLLHQGM